MATGLNFSTQVDAWVKKTRARMEAVFKESVQDVVDLMQTPIGAGGNMPVDTNRLRASLRGVNGSVQSLPALKADQLSVSFEDGQVAMVIANADIGEAVTFIYQAAYARRVNYGFVGTDSLGREYNQTGRHFVDKAAQQWQRIVNENAGRLKASTA